jgi:hypothetical protein
VLGAGLEPASLSAYAPQTYVSASSTTRALESEKLSAEESDWQVSFVFSLLMLMLVIVIEITSTDSSSHGSYEIGLIHG